MNEQTETAWFKTITINQIATIASIVFIAGGIYTKVLASEEKTQENRKKIEGIERDIGTIKTDIEVTKNEVKNLGAKLERSVQQQDEILRILRSRDRRD